MRAQGNGHTSPARTASESAKPSEVVPKAEPTVACDVVLPCRDEALALPSVFAGWPSALRAVVVDNGSMDGTAAVARRYGAQVVTEATPGYGSAVHAGVAAARAPYVAVLDADGSMSAVELLDLLELVQTGQATMAVGRRRPVARGVWPWHARAGTLLLAWWLRRRTGLPVHDIAPMRVCSREDLLALNVADRRFGYPLELLLRASQAGWTVREVDVSYGHRAAGTRSKVSGSIRGTLGTIRDFARVMA